MKLPTWSLLRSDGWTLANRLAATTLLVAAIAISLLFFDLNQVNRNLQYSGE